MDTSPLLSASQRDIVVECLAKKGGGLSLPMGSGKTLVSLTVALQQSKGKPVLVVVSKTLIGSWLHEINKFFKGIPYEVVHKDANRHVDTWSMNKATRIVLTTSEVLSKAFRENNLQHVVVTHLYIQGSVVITNYHNVAEP